MLVNNAGIMLLSTIAATFERPINVNLKGTFNTLREAAKRLREGGRIINFSSSVVGLLYGAYAGTKAAVEAMTSILAKELRGRSITANAVAPGPTCSCMASRKRWSIASSSSPRWSASASRRTSPHRRLPRRRLDPCGPGTSHSWIPAFAGNAGRGPRLPYR